MSDHEDAPVTDAMPDQTRLHRRTTFDDDAERYDRTRPGYPATLFDALADAAGLRAGSRVLEVAPGTGQATTSLAERGWRVTAVELGPQMAALARRSAAQVPGADVDVVVAPFEDWSLPDEPFDAVLCATAWHWLDPAVRARKAAQALRPGGVLGVVRSHHVAGGTSAFFEAADGCWREFGQRDSGGDTRFRLAPESEVRPATAELERSGCFAEVTAHGFPVEVEYTTAQYLDLLSTYSQVAVLDPEARAGLLGGVGRVADEQFDGRISHRYFFELVLARTPSSPLLA